MNQNRLCVEQTVLLNVRVRLVLREEHKTWVYRTQEHGRDLDPILRLCLTQSSSHHLLAAQQRLQVGSAHVRERPLVHVLWTLQQPHRHVPAQEGHPLQQEAPRARHARLVAAPVLQSVIAELLDDVQPLSRADVPVT